MKDWHELVSQPKYRVKSEKNVYVPMRDGVRLCIDIYYPDAQGKFPALIAVSPYGKELQTLADPARPYSVFHGAGGVEAGKTEFWVSRGYAHVIADTRGSGYSEGNYCFYGKKEHEDGYDLVEWIAKQPWCNGNVGMIGMSYFAIIQYPIAAQNPPHLKAIAPCEGLTDRYRQSCYHGGILNYGFYARWWNLLAVPSFEPLSKKEFPKDKLDQMIGDLKNHVDFKTFPVAYLPFICPEKNPILFDLYMHPHDGPFYWERSAYTMFDKIKIPVYILNRWSGWGIHLPGAFSAYQGIDAPKKLMIFTTGVRGPDRPWGQNHNEILRWYDHWLKGVDTGLMNEPPIKIWVQGIDEWRYENKWPLARTRWTKLFLREKGNLSEEPPGSGEKPDSFINRLYWDPKEQTPCVKYTTERFTKDVETTGPIALYLKAMLSTEDANWMVDILDIAQDGSERLVTKGWLKASHRAIDQSKSKSYQPFHPHTESIPVKPSEILEYVIEIRETSNVFRAGHSLQLVIKGEDSPYEDPVWYHLPNMRETKHTVYHNDHDVSYLLIPIIPE
jgi:predicted acyl esterase